MIAIGMFWPLLDVSVILAISKFIMSYACYGRVYIVIDDNN